MAFSMERGPSAEGKAGSNGSGSSLEPEHRARPPTSAEIDAVIAAAMANAPPHMAPPPEPIEEGFLRTGTPLMTNLLPSAVGMDGRVNLFVGNLPYRVRWQDLKDLFRKAGTVLRADVSLGPDNRSRGYGTVLLGSREDAARAIDRFNGYTWQTRTLEVRPDRLPPEYEAQPHVNPRPFPFPPGNYPGPRYSPHPPPPGLAPSPVPGNSSPPQNPMVAGMNITPSPLAGALTGPMPDMERRGSLAPFDHSRPSSTVPDRNNRSSFSDAPFPQRDRGSFSDAHLPGLRDRSSFSSEAPFLQRGDRASFSSDAAPHFPVQIDGLAHQGMGLGPPSNLHDRVVFVSNMPLTMQWQDLKDFLRPAGMIMRADVAQDDNRKPRGYGTALFATETDAARAVNMFNGREIGGRQIRVYLERQSRQPQSQSYESAQFRQMQHESSPAKVPWGINTGISTPQRFDTSSPEATPGPNFRASHHPGPISMPPFSPLRTPGPLSPLQTRNLPPMTPSMPGFVFNAFQPETPSIRGYHPFLSPGIAGPFSPGIPMNSPGQFGYNPFINAAPGGPVDRLSGNGNSFAGSAALGTPTTTGFPPGNPVHGWGGAPGGPANGNGSPGVTPNGNGNYQQEYFPITPAESPIRPKVATGQMPLNARDRLASTAEAVEGALGRLNIDTPESPGGRKQQLPEEEDSRGRYSLDGDRPVMSAVTGLKVSEGGGERRASFGDAGK